MLRWRNISLHWQLMLLTMVSSSVGMVVAMTLLFIYNDHRIREDKVEELRSAADLIGTNSVAALVFEDQAEGARILQALHTRRHIRQGVLYRADGKIVARYQRAGFQGGPPEVSNPGSEVIRWTNDHLELSRPLELEDRKIGAIYLEASLEDLQQARRDSLLLRIPAFMLALLVVYLLTFLLRSSLTGPIQRLAKVAREVADRKNYSLRAPGLGGAELGQLGRDFNHMLVVIEAGNQELQEARDSLEARVRERTKELEKEIAERQRTAVMLLEAKQAAEAANDAKSQFLANVSHEIRTPMNGILGMTELALDTPLSVEQREYLGIVQGCAVSLLEIIDDVLDFSKIENGKIELEKIPFSILDCAENALQPVAVRAQQKGLGLEWYIRGELPEWVTGDPTRLRQVLINLLGNAVKFTEEGEITLGIEYLHGDGESHSAKFSVTDTGIGIPAENRAKIFEAFQQSDNSVTRQYGGTGLGLSISARLIALMGGELQLESEVGKGSTFFFELQWKRAEERESKSRQKLEQRKLPAARILVTDDREAGRELVCWLTSRWGLEADTAGTMEKAAALYAKSVEEGRPYAAALINLNLAGKDGHGLAKEIRRCAPYDATAIVMMSSAPSFVEDARTNDYRILQRLTKPLRRRILRECLNSALRGDERAVATEIKKPKEISGASCRILIVEDNEVNQKLAQKLLEKMGHEVRLVANGEEACQALQRHEFDLVLMDLQMPVMGGLEATRKIRVSEHDSTCGCARSAALRGRRNGRISEQADPA
jgi:two-component system sensor histidine kinase/response regulator